MVSGEQEESSSSPNVNERIQTIQERGNSGNLLYVGTSEGSSFFIAPEFLTSQDSWLKQGCLLNQDQFERLKELHQLRACRKRALDLLARRSHSRLEIHRKLLQKEFPQIMVVDCCQWLEQKGYLNDLEFAQSWVRQQRRSAKKSRNALAIMLREKGISRDLAHQALAEYSVDQEEQACKKIMESFVRRGLDREKINRRLINRGFQYAMIRNLWEDLNHAEEKDN